MGGKIERVCGIRPDLNLSNNCFLLLSCYLDFTGEFLLSVNHDVKESTKESYFLLHPFVTRKAETSLGPKPKREKVADETAKELPVRSVEELDDITKGFRLRELGYVEYLIFFPCAPSSSRFLQVCCKLVLMTF